MYLVFVLFNGVDGGEYGQCCRCDSHGCSRCPREDPHSVSAYIIAGVNTVGSLRKAHRH